MSCSLPVCGYISAQQLCKQISRVDNKQLFLITQNLQRLQNIYLWTKLNGTGSRNASEFDSFWNLLSHKTLEILIEWRSAIEQLEWKCFYGKFLIRFQTSLEYLFSRVRKESRIIRRIIRGTYYKTYMLHLHVVLWSNVFFQSEGRHLLTK